MQFCLVGATGVVIDLTIYALLLSAAIQIEIARALAIWGAMTWNFSLNRRFTFSCDPDTPVMRQYFSFCLSCAFGALVSWLTSVGLSKTIIFFQRRWMVAALIGIFAGTLSNFLMSKLWVFRRPNPKIKVLDDR
jgi:dolichol-phosphate mannosyltransferase